MEEETDYKNRRHDWTELILPAAETLVRWARSINEPPKPCTESLRAGIIEMKRLHVLDR